MDDIKDLLLRGKFTSPGDVQSEIDPFGEGLFIAGLTSNQVQVYGEFLNSLYQRVRDHHKRQVTRNGLTMLQGAIFALGTERIKNPEWKEHCASSLREIFHEWDEGQIEADFVKFYRDRGEKLTNDESEVFRGFRHHYRYFTGIDHHNASTILNSLIAILKDNTLKLEDCYKDQVFLERVKEFFSKLSQIIELSGRELS